LDDPPALRPPKQRFGLEAFLEDTQDITGGTLPVSVVIATVIGLVCGVVAYLYYTMLEFLLEFIWKDLPERFFVADVSFPESLYWTWIPIVGMACAAGVGTSIQMFGEPGDLAYTVACVHKKGYIALSHVLPMLFASQFSILSGGSLGPEAPLVAICASVAGWVSRVVFQQKYKNVVRKHTLMGMACALAAFFGVPLGGSLFAVRSDMLQF
jgi:H+/Cl- antiporter ClcA